MLAWLCNPTGRDRAGRPSLCPAGRRRPARRLVLQWCPMLDLLVTERAAAMVEATRVRAHRLPPCVFQAGLFRSGSHAVLPPGRAPQLQAGCGGASYIPACKYLLRTWDGHVASSISTQDHLLVPAYGSMVITMLHPTTYASRASGPASQRPGRGACLDSAG